MTDSVPSTDHILERTLRVYFQTNPQKSILVNVLFHRGKVSLRLLDYLCTNYSKHNNASYELKKESSTASARTFHIYQSYKTQLKTFSKKFFDPFCRRDRIDIVVRDEVYHKDLQVLTTIGQLNFFRWCIHNKVYEYALQHHEQIEKEMNQVLQRRTLHKHSEGAKKESVGSSDFLVSFR